MVIIDLEGGRYRQIHRNISRGILTRKLVKLCLYPISNISTKKTQGNHAPSTVYIYINNLFITFEKKIEMYLLKHKTSWRYIHA